MLVAVPAGVVTRIRPVVASGGIGALIEVALSSVKLVASVRLKVTFVAPVRFVPVIVTRLPALPDDGEKPVTVGMR